MHLHASFLEEEFCVSCRNRDEEQEQRIWSSLLIAFCITIVPAVFGSSCNTFWVTAGFFSHGYYCTVLRRMFKVCAIAENFRKHFQPISTIYYSVCMSSVCLALPVCKHVFVYAYKHTFFAHIGTKTKGMWNNWQNTNFSS